MDGIGNSPRYGEIIVMIDLCSVLQSRYIYLFQSKLVSMLVVHFYPCFDTYPYTFHDGCR